MAKIPFDIKFRPQIESGEYKVVNSNGEPVRIICWDARIDFPNGIRSIVSLQLIDKKYEVVSNHLENGKIYSFKDSPADLFIVMPEEELTEFEKALAELVNDALTKEPQNPAVWIVGSGWTDKLLALASEQLIKEGYVIEKKAFHDAVEKVDPEVMKEVSDNVDKENELTKKYLEGYTQGYKDAEKKYNESVAYCNPTMPTTPSDFGCDGIRCTNPHMDCINCPRKTTGGTITTPNIASGTSTATLHGNTSATDGKEYNPSFTD